MTNVLTMVLTGCGPNDGKGLDAAVTERARQIIPSIVEKKEVHGLGMLYYGSRCSPENLPWRIYQTCWGTDLGKKPNISPDDVLAGKYDSEIERGYHDAASAEYWYAYEKQWD